MFRICKILLCLQLIASPVWAETLVLTWDDCVARAQNQHPQLQAELARLQQAQARAQDSYNYYFPTLSLDASYTQSGTGTSANGGSNSLSAALQKKLFSTDSDQAQVDQAGADLDDEQNAAQTLKTNLSLELHKAFIEMLYQQDAIDLTQKIALRRNANLELVALRYEAGREHKGSLLRNQAAQQQANIDVLQTYRALAVARRHLSVALGGAPLTEYFVTGSLEIKLPPATPSYEMLAVHLPDFHAALNQIKTAQADLILAQHAYQPGISAKSSVSRSGSDLSLANPNWSAAISFSLPVYFDPRNELGQTEAQAAVDEARFELTHLLHTLVYKLEDQFVAFQNAAETVAVQQAFLAAAETRSEIASSQYTTGLLSFENWDVIENDLIQQQKTMLTRQRDAALAAAAWEQIQGLGVLQ